ncbi:Polysaccharide deacetylase [Kalmanozyma brasiliensis GHG001]|uniref:Chitin deacetylase 3 n=1 Tax=Kalmanozyma brasiliensis (strain GHG001) TaxID=1365824 RepID=V5EVK1_KALBG|nr:Polysaccharide deacetylase [Kalmanozyma brasiliensis GHG001]EST06259.1 Polysaccharide deacetylase [Kalmanozyma brasiliensis GHG001]
MRFTAVAVGAMALAAPMVSAATRHQRGLVHPSEHRAGDLFQKRGDEQHHSITKRQLASVSKNGMPYPPAGSDPPPASSLPQAWIDRYNQKKAAGLIPNIPLSVTDPVTRATAYPAGTDMTNVCSWTVQKCDTGDIWLAPDNYVSITFDDGPTPQSHLLIDYLSAQRQTATHFLIGSAIVWNPDAMDLYVKSDPPMHLGVHTWSHTLQTNKNDLQVLGDLGWTMQIIYDLTGSVPMYWRPPEGDVDARVRAIATEVLGLQTVMWNKDADDWCLRQGSGTAQLQTCTTGIGATSQSVTREMVSWADTNNRTGFISLEHETTDQAIEAFQTYHRALKANNWIVGAVPELQGLPYYQNQWNLTTPKQRVDSILPTRQAINVVHSDARRGSRNAPDTSAFADLAGSGQGARASQAASAARASGSSSGSAAAATGAGSSSSGSGSSGSGSSGGSSTGTVGATNKGSSSTSGASSLVAGASTVGLGAIAAALALVL